jgi:hypothetical protein
MAEADTRTQHTLKSISVWVGVYPVSTHVSSLLVRRGVFPDCESFKKWHRQWMYSLVLLTCFLLPTTRTLNVGAEERMQIHIIKNLIYMLFYIKKNSIVSYPAFWGFPPLFLFCIEVRIMVVLTTEVHHAHGSKVVNHNKVADRAEGRALFPSIWVDSEHKEAFDC